MEGLGARTYNSNAIGNNFLVSGRNQPDDVRLPDRVWIRMCFTEAIATMFFTFITLLPLATGSSDAAYALAVGFSILFIQYTFSFLTHQEMVGHCNPFVTISYACLGKLSWAVCLIYVLVSQPVGSAVAAAIVYGLMPTGSPAGTPVVGSGYTDYQAFGAELMGSFIIVSIYLWTTVYRYKQTIIMKTYTFDLVRLDKIRFDPFAIAGAMFSVTVACAMISNSLFNPYRYLWISVYTQLITSMGAFIWILGPTLGAGLALFVAAMFAYWIEYDYQKLSEDTKLYGTVRNPTLLSMEKNKGK